MRGFYWLWLRRAFTQSLGPIDLWTGLAGAVIGVVDHYQPEWRLMTAAWQIPIWALAFVMAARLLMAPYWIWKDNADKIAKLEAVNAIPDIEIESTSRAQISEEQPDEAKGKDGGIFIVFDRVKVINRDERRASLEFHLRVNLGPGAFIRCGQIPEWLAEGSGLFQAGAHRLPSILNIEPRTTAVGYLAFFWPYPVSETTEMVLRVGRNKTGTSLLEVVERYDFDILVDEHTSETHHEIPAGKHIQYSLRRKAEGSDGSR